MHSSTPNNPILTLRSCGRPRSVFILLVSSLTLVCFCWLTRDASPVDIWLTRAGTRARWLFPPWNELEDDCNLLQTHCAVTWIRRSPGMWASASGFFRLRLVFWSCQVPKLHCMSPTMRVHNPLIGWKFTENHNSSDMREKPPSDYFSPSPGGSLSCVTPLITPTLGKCWLNFRMGCWTLRQHLTENPF